MKKRIFALLLATLSSGVVSSAVMAEDNFKNVEEAVAYRQSTFSLIAHNFGEMAAMIKGKKEFNGEVFALRANHVAALSKIPLEGFVANSAVKGSDAKADIWSNKADFDSQMQAFVENAQMLAQVAQTGDKGKIKKAFGQVGKGCKSCHGDYKAD